MAAWISRDILSKLQNAVERKDDTTSVFYITSGGGEGKTVLLRQLGLWLGSSDGILPCKTVLDNGGNVRFSGILDLYHSEVNTNSGLESHLMKSITERAEFRDFIQGREIFTARRRSGLPPAELEEERRKMSLTFASCFNKVSQWARVVTAIDTAERVQYEMDEIQQECGISGETTNVCEWLITQLSLWKNAVVLVVGRPEDEKNPYLSKELEEKIKGAPGVHYEHITLGGFNSQEAERFFDQARQEAELAEILHPDFCKKLSEGVHCSPIRLELAMEAIRRGYEVEELIDMVEQGTPKQIQDKIDELLINHVLNPEPHHKENLVLRYLAVARKGLNLDLLLYLVNAPDQAAEWREGFEQLQKRFFIKIPAGETRLFLHDEMYRFCDRYWYQPADAQEMCARIVAWYDQHIKAATDDKTQQELEIESLVYRLRANPIDGYHWYVRKAEFAIRAAQVGYDLRLRNELISFLTSVSAVDTALLENAPGVKKEWNRDSVANWVKRLQVRGANDEAIHIYEYIVAHKKKLYDDTPEGELSQADRDVFAAASMMYSNQTQRAADLLQNVIQRLEKGKSPAEVAQRKDGEYLDWRRNLLLGRAHNNLGYAYWNYLWRLNQALIEFSSALVYFTLSDLKEEVANTNDNMGRVHIVLLHRSRAEVLIEEGLKVRRLEKRKYREALSLISKAIFYLDFGEPHRAQRLCEQAISMFGDLEVKRGEGLAKIVLARTLRILSTLRPDLYSNEICLENLTKAAQYASEAGAIFKNMVSEPIRVVEVLNELGCIFRLRAIIMQEEQDLMFAGVSGRAVELLEQAAEYSKAFATPVWYIDNKEDQAEVHLLRQEYAEAETCLNDAESQVPAAYKLTQGVFPEVDEDEQVEIYWQMMGKIEYARGHLAIERGTKGGALPITLEIVMQGLRHFMVSVLYFDQYYSREVSPGLRSTFRQIYTRIQPLTFDEKLYLANHGMKQIADELNIDVGRFSEFYEGTIGLAIGIE